MKQLMVVLAAVGVIHAMAGGLPTGYRELGYVESHGTEWFDTGVVPDAGTVCTVDVTPLNEVVQSRVVSARNVSYEGMCGYLYFEVYVNGAGRWSCALKDDVGNWGSHRDMPYMRVGERIRLTLNADLATFTAGDSSSAIENATRANKGQCAIQFMAQTKGATDSDALWPAFVGRFHGATILQDGVVVREFIPCRRESDGAVGLYDIASHLDEAPCERFYANQGTGALTAGIMLDVADGKASVAFQPASVSRTLYLAYGTTDGGDLTNGWEHVVAVATIPAGAGTADKITLPLGLGSTYSFVRAFLAFEDTRREMYLRTTRDYVQDGLFAQWDGAENAGFAVHNDSAEGPAELKGAPFSSLSRAGTLPVVDAKSFAFGSGYLYFESSALTNAVNSGTLTVEMVLAENGGFVHNGGLITIGSATRGFWAYQQYYDGSNNGMINSYAYHGAPSDYTIVGLSPKGTQGIHTYSFALGDSTDNSFYVVNGGSPETVNRAATDMTDDKCYIGRLLNNGAMPNAKVYSIRIYTRKLSLDDIAANSAIDDIRFRSELLDSSSTWPRRLGVVNTQLTDGTLDVCLPVSEHAQMLWLAYDKEDKGGRLSDWTNATMICKIPAGVAVTNGIVVSKAIRKGLRRRGGFRLFIMPAADAYVQRGLYAQWDGVENMGMGQRDPAATYPRELTGNVPSISVTGTLPPSGYRAFAFGSGELSMDLPNMKTALNNGNATVELVLEENGDFVHNGGLITIGSATRGFWAYQQYNDSNNGMINAYAYHGASTDYKVVGLSPKGTQGIHTYSFALGDSTANSFYAVNGGSPVTVNRAATDMTDDICHIGSLDTHKILPKAKVYSIRLYAEKLTADEIAANAELDRERFNETCDVSSRFYSNVLPGLIIVVR